MYIVGINVIISSVLRLIACQKLQRHIKHFVSEYYLLIQNRGQIDLLKMSILGVFCRVIIKTSVKRMAPTQYFNCDWNTLEWETERLDFLLGSFKYVRS